jgi:hypothetical protein
VEADAEVQCDSREGDRDAETTALKRLMLSAIADKQKERNITTHKQENANETNRNLLASSATSKHRHFQRHLKTVSKIVAPCNCASKACYPSRLNTYIALQQQQLGAAANGASTSNVY